MGCAVGVVLIVVLPLGSVGLRYCALLVRPLTWSSRLAWGLYSHAQLRGRCQRGDLGKNPDACQTTSLSPRSASVCATVRCLRAAYHGPPPWQRRFALLCAACAPAYLVLPLGLGSVQPCPTQRTVPKRESRQKTRRVSNHLSVATISVGLRYCALFAWRLSWSSPLAASLCATVRCLCAR